ncbi:MAG: hypothetical protein R3A10_07870 [Caldilineaceae bacterium]
MTKCSSTTGEEIVTLQPRDDRGLVGRDRGRVAVVDHQRLHRRTRFFRAGHGIHGAGW